MKNVLLGILIVILVAGCGFGAYSYYNQNKEIKDLKAEVKDLKADLDKKAKEEATTEEFQEMSPDQIACQVFENKLKSDKTVASYKINECNLVYRCDNNYDKVVIGVNYDVTSVSKETMWAAGNGEINEATLTVSGKSQFFGYKKVNGEYVEDWSATGIIGELSETCKDFK